MAIHFVKKFPDVAGTDSASLFVCAVGAQGWVTASCSVSRQDSTAPALLLREPVRARSRDVLLV